MQLFPSFERFGELADDSGVVPVYGEFLSGVENAVTAYAKLAEPPFGFLLKSVAGANNGLVTPFLKHDPGPDGLLVFTDIMLASTRCGRSSERRRW